MDYDQQEKKNSRVLDTYIATYLYTLKKRATRKAGWDFHETKKPGGSHTEVSVWHTPFPHKNPSLGQWLCFLLHTRYLLSVQYCFGSVGINSFPCFRRRYGLYRQTDTGEGGESLSKQKCMYAFQEWTTAYDICPGRCRWNWSVRCVQ